MAFSAETRKQIKKLAGNKCEITGKSNDEWYLDCSHNNHSRTEIDPHTGQTFYDLAENGMLVAIDVHLDMSDDPLHKELIQKRIDKHGLRRKVIYRANWVFTI